MRRRKRETSDSLELLLDTICNTFGGIVFLALLICLISGKQSAEKQANTTPQQILDKSQLLSDIRQLKHDLNLSYNSIQLQQSTISNLAKVAELPSSSIDSIERLINLKSQSLELEKEMLSLNNENLELNSNIAQLSVKLSKSKETLSKINEQINYNKKMQIPNLRLPVAHDTNKRQVPIAISHSKATVVFSYSDGIPKNPNPDLILALSDNELSKDELNAASGQIVKKDADTREWTNSLTTRFSSNRHYFCLAVWPDSYEEFCILRDSLIENGFEYQVLLMNNDSVLTFGNSGNHQVQ